MSNLTTFNPSQLPSFARKGELSSIAKALTGGGTGTSMKRISTKGGVFRLIAGGKEVAAIEDRHLDVVIVNAAPKVSRTFYAGQFVEGQATAPNCWSADGDLPDASVAEPQAKSCATCPQNVKGSGQGDSRACRFSQRLAVVLANDIEGDVMQLTLAATSIFGKEDGDKRPLQAYARYLAAQNISPETLVTRLKFDTKAAVPKLFFQPVRWLDDTEFSTITDKGQSDEAKKAITMTVSQSDGIKPLALEGKKPEAKAVPEVEETGEVDEPEVRKEAKAKPTAVPKKAGNLASVVDNWDADDE
jgi:hypothetical protein